MKRQRPQQLFFPDGIAFDEMRFVRTGVNSPAFNYLTTIEPSKTNLVDQIFTSWNQLTSWLQEIELFRTAA